MYRNKSNFTPHDLLSIEYSAKKLANIVSNSKSPLVLPLGGTERVGMNMTLYADKGRCIIVDLGSTFLGADDDRVADIEETVDGKMRGIFPDPRVLKYCIPMIDGIVLTHAHEDHIGALIPILLSSPEIPGIEKIPLYTTSYTASVIDRRCQQYDLNPAIHKMKFRKPVKIGPFNVAPVLVTHSAPETSAIAIATSKGILVHCSDFKLDNDPLLGSTTDFDSFDILSKNNVLAFLGDSTNAQRNGWSTSEKDVFHGFTNVMKASRGKVVISTFASNLSRIEAARLAAKAAGRNLAVSGFTISANLNSGLESGYLTDPQAKMLEPRDVRHLDSRHIALVCSGTQAEQGSMLRRMAEDLELTVGNYQPFGRQPRMRLAPGDTVIHSARIIPGNETTVKAMFSIMEKCGVNVLTADNKDFCLHASGHAAREELETLYKLVKPKYGIPIHGYNALRQAHEDIVRSSGSSVAITPSEGQFLSFENDSPQVFDGIDVPLVMSIEPHLKQTRLCVASFDFDKPISDSGIDQSLLKLSLKESDTYQSMDRGGFKFSKAV